MKAFMKLHDGSQLLRLPNAWDAGSARLFESLGAPAIATTSAGVAWAQGYADKPAYRPLTKFENRGIKLGHGVWDLVIRKK